MFLGKGGFEMNYPENELLNKKKKKIRNKAEDILNKGLVGEGSSKLEKTLDMHEHLKVLLDEFNFVLAEEDLPKECINKRISVIEKELEKIEMQL